MLSHRYVIGVVHIVVVSSSAEGACTTNRQNVSCTIIDADFISTEDKTQFHRSMQYSMHQN